MDRGREDVDPEGRYGPSRWTQTPVEALALRVRRLLPEASFERTRSCFEFEVEGEEGVVVLVTPEAVEVRLPTVTWMHPHEPMRWSRLWRRLPATRQDDRALEDALRGAQKARRAEFATCRFCGRSFPPEHRHEDDVCHGCAERHLGVVH